jgi:hypothetical protein
VGWIWEAWVDYDGGVVGCGLSLVREASVSDGGGVGGRGLDWDAWVEEKGGGGLEELGGGLGRTIWPSKKGSDSHLSRPGKSQPHNKNEINKKTQSIDKNSNNQMARRKNSIHSGNKVHWSTLLG